jgi:hypothetical protein
LRHKNRFTVEKVEEAELLPVKSDEKIVDIMERNEGEIPPAPTDYYNSGNKELATESALTLNRLEAVSSANLYIFGIFS